MLMRHRFLDCDWLDVAHADFLEHATGSGIANEIARGDALERPRIAERERDTAPAASVA